ncbi:phage integrase family protein [Cupriavidus taiwanensis]|uniref:phage integrase family protein n=1 Tax=Cupriavidus taiwanensis TaxID=164546 RepID=UPI000E1196D3|nr:phage integrase family protein [Cupriavidus taiwanensis]SPA46623.1 conserved hypothetical protein [Cupriavidus taiwanensis]
MPPHTLPPIIASAELVKGTEQSQTECPSNQTQPNIRTDGNRRRLRQEHFAVYRGYLEGLPIDALVERYLEPSEAASPREALRVIREELSMAAARLGWRKAVKLMRQPPNNPSSVHLRSRNLPTLEQFRARHDPDGVLSEKDLLISYREEVVPTGHSRDDIRRAARQSAIRRRQFSALSELSKVLTESPLARHPIAGWVEWIGPRVADHLAKVSVNTVGDLVNYINKFGYRWFTRVPRLGERTAQRLMNWLDRHTETIDCALSLSARRPQRTLTTEECANLVLERATETSVVPLEYYKRPGETLDGSLGTNRAPIGQNKIDANTDYDAIWAWIDVKKDIPQSAIARRKEAERILQWAVLERRKPLSSLTATDAACYLAFLVNPQPAQRWIGTRLVPRWHSDWRPFEKPLTPSSQASARANVNVLFTWLVSQGYLCADPFDGLPQTMLEFTDDAPLPLR